MTAASTSSDKFLRPGARLGVLGGGQLGRMFAQAAQRLGYSAAVFSPEPDSPAGRLAESELVAPYEDLAAVERFAREVDVLTFEFENVSAEAVRVAERFTAVRPSGALLHASQERLREKAALVELGLPVAPHAAVRSAADLEAAKEAVRFPAILKTAAFGYDGKGQVGVARAEDLGAAFQELGEVPCVLEQKLPFECEASIVGARGLDGEIALYEPFRNAHANHVLDVTTFPADLPPRVVEEAKAIGRAVLEGFDVCGVLCVELFVLEGGALVVNEIAPRPHNSGHVTIDAHRTSQFEQQVRAITGLPLGSVEPLVPAGAMANLLGDLWEGSEPRFADALSLPGVALHLYGKRDARPGRKMGHLTALAQDPGSAERAVREARAAL